MSLEKSNKNGFSLVEVLAVVFIIAIMMGLVVSVTGRTYNSQVKSDVSRLSAAIRYAYNEAAMKNLYYRIVFDIDKNTYWLEMSTEMVAPGSEEKKDEEKKTISTIAGDSSNETTPVKSGFEKIDSGPIKKIKLGDNVKFQDIFVAHQTKEVTEGKAYLYFFPTGMTEKTVIHFSDEDGEKSWTIFINPLTAKAKVFNEYKTEPD